jgi:hypothetical protein
LSDDAREKLDVLAHRRQSLAKHEVEIQREFPESSDEKDEHDSRVARRQLRGRDIARNLLWDWLNSSDHRAVITLIRLLNLKEGEHRGNPNGDYLTGCKME